MSDIATTDLEKQSLEAHVDLCALRYKNLDDRMTKIEKKVELTEKEKKKELKNIQKKLKDGKKKGILTENEILELEMKLDELQGNL